CDAFDAAWRAGVRPAIEPFLGDTPEPERTALLAELLALEVEYRVRAGERPTPAEYLPRFPGRAELIAAVFRKPVPPAPGGVTLTVTEGPHQGRTFTLSGHDTFLVGRSKQAHFQLPARDKYFSRLHFMVESNPPRCRLTDLGSHNGTYVNGRRVQTADLRPGDEIRAGHTVLAVTTTAAPDDEGTVTLRPEPATVPADVTTQVPAAGVLFPALPGYEVVREVGRGGMGIVYEARRRADGARVALKTVVPAEAASPVLVRRFLREARILCQLDHANIVAFREMGEGPGLLFFAMDYVEGTDAAKLLKRHGPLPVRTAVRLVCRVLAALEHAHGKKFVHRDIKPANVLLSEGGGKKAVKLADFGLARVYQASQLSGLTMQGEVGGTLAFMPPEQVTNFREVRPAADQYSAAATLYNLLTGRFLYDFREPGPAALATILTEDPVPIEKRRDDLPAGLAAAVHRAVARDPADRFPDVAAFRAALMPFGR
ncbi:MAG TPA: FHA domain-containing serine/threonine-protein kinase, partial [Gemmataceae bacterium]|nr:FHA domain-containing serine/threonine-protein kinase [Gemmataceae bacterium]